MRSFLIQRPLIAMAIIDLAHHMHLKVVAEGVETDDQLEFLRQHGCDQMQGHLFSRPLPEPALRALLLEGKTLPPGQRRRSKSNTAAALR